MQDYGEKCKKDPSVVEVKVLEDDADHKVIYSESRIPLCDNRTCVVDVRTDYTIDDGNAALVITQSVNRDDCPEVKGKVRMFMISASLAKMDGEYLQVTDFVRMSLGGRVPQWLMNMSLASMAKEEVALFHEELKKV